MQTASMDLVGSDEVRVRSQRRGLSGLADRSSHPSSVSVGAVQYRLAGTSGPVGYPHRHSADSLLRTGRPTVGRSARGRSAGLHVVAVADDTVIDDHDAGVVEVA